MDFTLSSEQLLIRETVRDYGKNRYKFADRQRILRSQDGFSREHWKAFADLGWLGVILAEDVGGSDATPIDMAIILEGFGQCLVLEPFVECAIHAAQILNIAATAEQRTRLLAPLVRGELILAVAHDKPAADLGAVEPRAAPLPDGRYRLTGRRAFVAGGGCADAVIVAARTSERRVDRDGLTCFVVPCTAPGLVRQTFRTVDGTHAAEFVFNDVDLDQAAVVGSPGQAQPVLEDAADWATVATCAEAVGAMDAVVSITAEFLKTRRAYGTTLSTFQGLQHRLADMLVDLELSRSILYRALAMLPSSDRAVRRRTVAAAKALIGRNGRNVGGHGIQLHGGMGMSDEAIVGHLFKRLTVIERQLGSSDAHLARLASEPDPEHEHNEHSRLPLDSTPLNYEELHK